MPEIIYASLVIACASFSQSISGVGFVMLATPFLLEIVNVRDTVIIAFALAVISQILIVRKHWRLIHPQMFVNFVLGSALGAPLGLWFFSISSHAVLTLTIGLSMFGISLFSLWKIHRQWHVMDTVIGYQYSAKTPAVWRPGELVRGLAEGGGKVQFLVGIVAGFFGPSIGMPGIPLSVATQSDYPLFIMQDAGGTNVIAPLGRKQRICPFTADEWLADEKPSTVANYLL